MFYVSPLQVDFIKLPKVLSGPLGRILKYRAHITDTNVLLEKLCFLSDTASVYSPYLHKLSSHQP